MPKKERVDLSEVFKSKRILPTAGPAPSQKQESDPKKLEELKQSEIQDLLAKSEISLILDSYDDIFSDFDPRPYSERALSDDFLLESRKAARDKHHASELKFLIPEKMRNISVEAKIKKRLKDHFKKHEAEFRKETEDITKRGIAVAFIGFVLMLCATYLYDVEHSNFGLQFLRTMIEPSGWFMVWYGLDQIFYSRNQHKPDWEFYKKMSSANIIFMSA